MTAANRATLAAVLGVWNGAPSEGLAALLAPGYRGHMLGAPDGERDGAGYGERILRYRAAFPHARFEVVEQFAADDRLVTRLEAHRPGAGSEPASVSHGINISRFDEGRLSEEWAIWSPWQVRGEAGEEAST